MQCVHGRDVGFGFECWECEAEKRRHEEALDLQQQALAEQQRAHDQQQHRHQELLEAQERQEELLREAAHSREMAARAQQERLDLQRRQIEEERARQQADEERLELRTGLGEFSEAFRQSWLHLSEERETIGSRMAALRNALSHVAAEKTALSQSVRETWKVIHADLSKDLELQLERGTPRLKDPPPSLAHADTQEFETLSVNLHTLSKRIGATQAKVFLSDGPVSQLYRELSVFREKIQAFAMAPPSWPMPALGCFAFLLLCVAVGVKTALRDQRAVGAVIFYIAAASLPAILALRRLKLLNDLDHTYEPTLQCLSAILPLLTKIADVKFDRLSDIAAGAKSREARLKRMAENANVTLRNIVLVLQDLYKRDNFALHALAPRLEGLESEAKRKATRIEEITMELKYSEQDTRVMAHSDAMRREIRRIGRLILDGRRLPGARLELAQCPACGGPVSSETKSCPYCARAFGNHA